MFLMSSTPAHLTGKFYNTDTFMVLVLDRKLYDIFVKDSNISAQPKLTF